MSDCPTLFKAKTPRLPEGLRRRSPLMGLGDDEASGVLMLDPQSWFLKQISLANNEGERGRNGHPFSFRPRAYWPALRSAAVLSRFHTTWASLNWAMFIGRSSNLWNLNLPVDGPAAA